MKGVHSAFHGSSHSGSHVGHSGHGGGDPLIVVLGVPLMLVALLGLRRDHFMDRLAPLFPRGCGESHLRWISWSVILLLYAAVGLLFAACASGGWRWTPELVFAVVELARPHYNETSGA